MNFPLPWMALSLLAMTCATGHCAPTPAPTPMGLSGEHLRMESTGGTTLISHFGKNELNHLRPAKKEENFLSVLGGGEEEGREGFVVAVRNSDDVIKPLEWKLTESTASLLRFRDASGAFEATLSLKEGSSGLDLELIALPGTTPATYKALELTWTLQVGGDFLAVTTEGVADRELIPLLSEGKPRLHHADIEREGNASFALSQPWFAVSDRNKAVTLGICFYPPGATLKAWSGQLLGEEAMSRTLVFPASSEPLRVRMMLFEPMEAVSALIPEGAFQWQPPETVRFLPSRVLDKGHLRLLPAGDGAPVLEAPITGWKPGKVETFQVKGLSSPPFVELATPSGITRIRLLD